MQCFSKIAISNSPDGINWTKSPQNPILANEPDSWDFPRVDDPTVVFDGTSYKMWYLGGEHSSWQMGYATSEDGVNWTKSTANPVLKTGPEGTWDDSSVGFLAVLDSAGIKFKMWYGGSDDPNRLGSIGFAESDTRVPILTMKNIPLLDTTMTLEVEISLDGSVYIVHLDSWLLADSILKYKVRSVDAVANTLTGIPLTEVYPGKYYVTAISEFGYVSYQGYAIEIADDLTPPELTLEKESVGYNEPIIASSSKDGILFLVDDTTPSNLNYIRSSKFLINSAAVNANVPVEFASEGLNGGEYILFAPDNYGALSTPKNFVILGVGINQSVSDQNRVSIYPNPTDKQLMIHLRKQGDHSLRICALSGQELIGFEWKGGSREIDLSSIDPGVYLITIASEDHRWTGKLVKLK